MAKTNGNVHCAIITPERQVFDADVNFVALPGHDGQFGILSDRAPLLCKLGIGVLRVKQGDQEKRFYVDGGFAQVRENSVIVLTPAAGEPAQIDRKAAQASLDAAMNMPMKDETSLRARTTAIAKAKVRLSLVS